MPAVTLRLLSDTPDNVGLVQRVLDDAPAFFRMSHGDVARADESARTFRDLPPGVDARDRV
jgi:hypothetical protein